MPNVFTRAIGALRARIAYTGGADFWNTPPSLIHKGGSNVTPDTALQVSTAYACIRAIANTMAYLPKGIFEEDETGKQVLRAHPVHELIASRPNSYETAFQFWARMFTSSLCYGRGVALIDRDAFTGYPKAMHVVHLEANVIPSVSWHGHRHGIGNATVHHVHACGTDDGVEVDLSLHKQGQAHPQPQSHKNLHDPGV